MKILTVPGDTPLLRQKSRPVKAIDRNLVRLMADMRKTLTSQRDPDGVGLSAVQIGKPVRIFALNHKYLDKIKSDKIIFYINPEIVGHSKEKTLGARQKLSAKSGSHLDGPEKVKPFLEGCLSVPDLYGTVRRWKSIKVKTMTVVEKDLDHPIQVLRFMIYDFAELSARVFQHEIDHLSGILFTDRVLKEDGQLYRWDGDEMVEMKL